MFTNLINHHIIGEKKETKYKPTNKGKSMERTIHLCFPARKGGVGKTMLAGNMAAYFANDGYRVLVVGTDSQEDITETYLAGTDFDIDNHHTLVEVLDGDIDIHDAIVKTPAFRKPRKKLQSYSFDMLPGGPDINHYPSDNLFVLRDAMQAVESEYDFIIYDTCPSDSESSMYVLMTCDYAVVPVTNQASFKSYNSILGDMELARECGSKIECLGVVLNNMTRINLLDKRNEELFREMLGDTVFMNVVHRCTAVTNADAYNVPVCSFNEGERFDDLYHLYLELKKRMGVI